MGRPTWLTGKINCQLRLKEYPMIQLNEALIPVVERLERIESKLDEKQVPKLMTIKDIISYASLSETTIRRHINRGTLKPFKEGGKKLFRRIDVNDWLRG